MATETEKLYNDQTGTATSPAAATPTSQVMTGNQSLDNYNTGRVNQINQMYDSQRDAALGQLESAHNRTMSDAQAAYDKITPKYQESRNAVGAEYERQRRNNNLQAQANGLNTGANSQMQLAASSVYQQNQAGLHKAENEALNESNRQMVTLKEQYEADVQDAIAKNDAQRAAALLNEYGQQYDRMQSEAKQLAAYGDFSLYAQLYGQQAADGMQRSWDLQNPALAYALGRLSAQDYFKLTGRYPPGSPEAQAQAEASGGSSRGGGYYGGGEPTETNKIDTTYTGVKNALAAGYTYDDIIAAANNEGLAQQQYQLATGQKQSTIAPASGGARGIGGATKKATTSNNQQTTPTNPASTQPTVKNNLDPLTIANRGLSGT